MSLKQILNTLSSESEVSFGNNSFDIENGVFSPDVYITDVNENYVFAMVEHQYYIGESNIFFLPEKSSKRKFIFVERKKGDKCVNNLVKEGKFDYVSLEDIQKLPCFKENSSNELIVYLENFISARNMEEMKEKIKNFKLIE